LQGFSCMLGNCYKLEKEKKGQKDKQKNNKK